MQNAETTIEQQIRAVLDSKTNAGDLTEKLFAPGALFSQLAPTPEERHRLIQTTLFREAQRRLTELHRHEAALFRRAVAEARASECRPVS